MHYNVDVCQSCKVQYDVYTDKNIQIQVESRGRKLF